MQTEPPVRSAAVKVVEVNWVIHPFRGDSFEEAWLPAAGAALDYGASAWAFFRSQDDPLHFTQLAYFDTKLDWERYWYSEEIAEARSRVIDWFVKPVTPVWYTVVDAGARERPAVPTG